MANTAKGLSLKYGRSIRKGESASGLPASVRVGDLILKERVFVRYPSHNSSASSQERSSVPFLKQKKPQNISPEVSVAWQRLDVSPYLRGVSPIARWAGCLCPCVTQRERSPCPSGGPNPGPLGCRGLAPRPRTWAARASTPARSSRRRRRNHLQTPPKKTHWTQLDTRVRAKSLALYSQHVTSVHVIYGAQHVVRRAGQAADAQTAVRALVAWVGAARERPQPDHRVWRSRNPSKQ